MLTGLQVSVTRALAARWQRWPAKANGLKDEGRESSPGLSWRTSGGETAGTLLGMADRECYRRPPGVLHPAAASFRLPDPGAQPQGSSQGPPQGLGGSPELRGKAPRNAAV